MSDVRILTAGRAVWKMPSTYDDLTGRRFGHLTAHHPVPSRSGLQWECACDCGGWAIKPARTLHETRNPDRLHCERCERGERIDWDRVLDDNRATIDYYRGGKRPR